MPYKANEPRRHRIPRARYRVSNWPEYDRALQQRGSLTVWVTPEALAAWHPPKTGRRGRSRTYSDIAIETGHLLRLAFGRPWRQTEGLLRSLATLLRLDIGVPDHTTFSRRSPGLMLAKSLAQAQRTGPVHVVIDSTGLKEYGAGEWLTEKHGERGQRTWRKLHLAVDPNSGEILASELTTIEQGDAALVGSLLDQITSPIASVTADGAYDGDPVYRAVAERQPDPPAAVVIPPRASAVPSPTADTVPSQRDQHIRMIRDKGRLGWQKAVGYGRRSLGESGPGWTDARIAEAVRVSVRTIERVRQRFVEDGLEAALLPRPSPRVYARKLDGAQEAKLVAVACSEPPEGKKRWTLRLLAERMVELEVVPELSHETVRQTLKKECAQAAPAADVVHPAPALGRVRVPHGRRAGGLSPPARPAAAGGLPGRVQQAADRRGAPPIAAAPGTR